MLREIPETAVLSARNEPAFLFSPHLLLIRLPMKYLLQLILEEERLGGIAHLAIAPPAELEPKLSAPPNVLLFLKTHLQCLLKV